MSAPRIAFVVAVAENGVIGRDGQLPWQVPSDLKVFRRLTLGKPIVMGRRTFDSIGKPLEGRDNIVVTRDRHFRHAGVIVSGSLEDALQHAVACARARTTDEVLIIGGAEIFRLALPLADRIYLTRIHGTPPGDTYLPPLDPDDWHEVRREPLPVDARDAYRATLIVYDRVRPPTPSRAATID